MKRARSTLADARAAIDDLRLEDRPLVRGGSVSNESLHTGNGHPLPSHIGFGRAENEVAPAVVEHSERIISESLANITRHAQADNVWLSLHQSDEELTIDIRDDGVGFDVETAVRAGHYGLLGIRERARLVNGALN